MIWSALPASSFDFESWLVACIIAPFLFFLKKIKIEFLKLVSQLLMQIVIFCFQVFHPVQCEACHCESFAGFRYKCQRCYNYNLCQTCFWRGRTSGNHSNEHEVKEYSFYVSLLKHSCFLSVFVMPVKFCLHWQFQELSGAADAVWLVDET